MACPSNSTTTALAVGPVTITSVCGIPLDEPILIAEGEGLVVRAGMRTNKTAIPRITLEWEEQ